jgi:hypothetical protein
MAGPAGGVAPKVPQDAWGTRVKPGGEGGEAEIGCDVPAVWSGRPGLCGGRGLVRPSRSRRRRRLTAAINAMSGAVAVGSLVVVIELGAPVASHLGLGPGPISAGHGAAVSQALNDQTGTGSGLATTSVANASSSAAVAGAPTAPTPASGTPLTNVVSSIAPSPAVAQPAVAATNGNVSSHVIAAPTATASVPSTNDGNGAAAHASVLVAAPTTDQGAPGQDAQQGGHGQNGQHGQGNGGQGNGNGNGGSNVPQGHAVGHSSH